MMIIDEHLLLAFEESPEYIPQAQLLYAFVGMYRGEPLFLKLTTKPKKKKKVKK